MIEKIKSKLRHFTYDYLRQTSTVLCWIVGANWVSTLEFPSLNWPDGLH